MLVIIFATICLNNFLFSVAQIKGELYFNCMYMYFGLVNGRPKHEGIVQGSCFLSKSSSSFGNLETTLFPWLKRQIFIVKIHILEGQGPLNLVTPRAEI